MQGRYHNDNLLDSYQGNVNSANSDYYSDDDYTQPMQNQKYSTNNVVSSSSMRLSVLEDKTKSLEKMIRLFEERLTIKEEQKLNDMKNSESSLTIINNLNKKVIYLEKQLNDFITQKNISDRENQEIISNLNKKILSLESQIKNQNSDKKNENNETKNYREEIENIIMNNNEQFGEMIKEQMYNMNMQNENKVNELLNLIQDVNKLFEETENDVNQLKNNYNKLQCDNLNLIRSLSIQSEKLKNIDFILQEVKLLKIKFNEFSIINPEKEEDKFASQYFASMNLK